MKNCIHNKINAGKTDNNYPKPFFFMVPIRMEYPGKLEKQILYDIENSLLQGVRFMQNAKKNRSSL